jgi:hypothetical protein
VVAEAASFPDVPWLAVQEVLGRLGWLETPLSTFANASRVSDLGKLDTTPAYRETLQGRLADLQTLCSFLGDWCDENLGSGLGRMHQALKVLPQLQCVAGPDGQAAIAELRRIAEDSRAIYSDEHHLLQADQRRPLKGKLEQFRQKYDQLYYGLHRRLVGDDAPWNQLDAVRKSARYIALNRLKGLPFISPAEFNQIALEIQGLERHRCRQFNAQVLETFVTCPYCRFPEDGVSLIDLDARADQLEGRLEELWARWGEQVLHELPGLSDRLPLLSREHRELVEGLQRKGQMPDEISDDLLAALHELSSDLQPVELDLGDLAQALLRRGSALRVDELRAALDAYLADLLRGYNRDMVRIKISPAEPAAE